jgi:hypothetical protein
MHVARMHRHGGHAASFGIAEVEMAALLMVPNEAGALQRSYQLARLDARHLSHPAVGTHTATVVGCRGWG